MKGIHIAFILFITSITIRIYTTFTEYMSVFEYGCLLSNIEKKIGSNIVDIVSLTSNNITVISHKNYMNKVYKIKYTGQTVNDVQEMYNEPMNDKEKLLYLKNKKPLL
tara:strand:- start:37007 stop:37330 length:324 start_codon:yes stop_codon:yes gene_type:complete